MKNIIIVFIMQFPFFAEASNFINIKSGMNYIDLNNDGVKDVIVLSTFENNTSHPSSLIASYIISRGGWYNISLNNGDLSILDYKLPASDTKLIGCKLYSSNNKVYLIIASKFNNISGGLDLFDSQRVTFD